MRRAAGSISCHDRIAYELACQIPPSPSHLRRCLSGYSRLADGTAGLSVGITAGRREWCGGPNACGGLLVRGVGHVPDSVTSE